MYHTFLVFLPASFLHLLLPSSSALLLFSPSLLTFCSKGNSRWVQLWSQSSGGHILKGFIYVWLSCKASNLTTEQAPPLPQIIPLHRLMTGIIIYFFTIYFSSSTSITPVWRCPSDYKQLGKDILQCRSRGEDGKSERIEKGRRRMTECMQPSSITSPAFCFSISTLYMCHL